MDTHPANSSHTGVDKNLPARITFTASKQTYYTIRFLMDRDRRQDAFRGYAYFRWVDDQLDCATGDQEEKRAFLNRQQRLLQACYHGEPCESLTQEEQILVDLVGNDTEKDSGLQLYLRSMMDVMAFDVERCGRLISEAELSRYTYMLAKAVTEYMFYFIGHKCSPVNREGRYQAVCGAHTMHMLRDLIKDIPVGYINIPAEIIEAEHISLDDLKPMDIRRWVFERVELARQYFREGRQYISQVKSWRCRMAGFLYLARFEWMLRVIVLDQYILHPDYPERKTIRAAGWVVWRGLISALNLPRLNPERSRRPELSE